MSTSSAPIVSPQETSAVRIRHVAIGALFALAQFAPKLLNVRQDPRTWLACRVLLALAGASLVILPLSLWNSWHAGIAGLLLFLAAILIPAAKTDTTLADTAAQLGAFAIVNGGVLVMEESQTQQSQIEPWQEAPLYRDLALPAIALEETPEPRTAQASAVHLFVCTDRIWALDSDLRPLLVIPAAQISSAIASESANDWIVRVRWVEHTANFHYSGLFAEHRARTAESTLRTVVQPGLPPALKKRAATA